MKKQSSRSQQSDTQIKQSKDVEQITIHNKSQIAKEKVSPDALIINSKPSRKSEGYDLE